MCWTGAPLPYVIFSHRAGGFVRAAPVQHIDAAYDVLCIAESAAAARAGAAHIAAALAGPSAPPLGGAGWVGLATTPGAALSALHNAEGRQSWHDGATYRIRMDKE
jgi:hypothetical protein